MPIPMPSAAYSFRDRWHVDAPPARVREVLVDVEHYVDWWPEVVAVAAAGEGAGTRLDFAQDVRVRGLLALASLPARPLLTWNHDRMMRSCRQGLARAVQQERE